MTNHGKSNNTKILIVGPLPPPTGGIARSVVNTLNSSLKNKYRLLHIDTSNKRKAEKQGKIDIPNLISFLKQILQLFFMLVWQYPRITQIETTFGISFFKHSFFVLMCKMFNKKIVLCIYGEKFEDFYNIASSIEKLYIKLILRLADAIKIESSRWKNFFIAQSGFLTSKIYPIPNAINLPKSKLKPLTLKNGGLKILYLAWVKKEKGIFDFLQSLTILKNKNLCFQADIIGPAGEKNIFEKIHNYIDKHGLKNSVKILGPKQSDQVDRYYQETDIYVLPSHSEGFSYTILEAMAYGLPVIATNVGGIPEMIEEKINGFLITPGDTDMLAKKIETLMQDKQMRNKIGRNNIKKIKAQFSMKKQVQSMISLYNNLLSR